MSIVMLEVTIPDLSINLSLRNPESCFPNPSTQWLGMQESYIYNIPLSSKTKNRWLYANGFMNIISDFHMYAPMVYTWIVCIIR